MELCGKTPTIIALTAKEWCEPCKKFEPEIIELKKTQNINYHIIQCDQADLTMTKYIDLFKIQGFPTVFIYLPKLNVFVIYDNSKKEKDLKLFISKIKNYSLAEINSNKLQIWTQIPNEEIKFNIDHGDSCSSI